MPSVTVFVTPTLYPILETDTGEPDPSVGFDIPGVCDANSGLPVTGSSDFGFGDTLSVMPDRIDIPEDVGLVTCV